MTGWWTTGWCSTVHVMWLALRLYQSFWILCAVLAAALFTTLTVDGPVGPVVLGAVLVAVSSGLRSWAFFLPGSRWGLVVQRGRLGYRLHDPESHSPTKA